MIGIGISTYLRPEVFEECWINIHKFLPEGAKVVVVSDADANPPIEADFVFSERAGVNNVKNKCLELLEGCDEIFLFDSDTWPKVKGWEKPYIGSPEPHLMYLFKDFIVNPRLNDAVEVYRDDKHFALSHPRGCMIYLNRSAIDVVGGMDTRFDKWGHEHVDLSNRIFNNGLTSFRFADVIGSNELIFSGDEHETVRTTVTSQERHKYLMSIQPLVKESRDATHYCEYMKRESPKGQNNIILTSYFTNDVDVQRGKIWESDFLSVKPLSESVFDKSGVKTVVLNNCFDDDLTLDLRKIELIRVNAVINPYFQRWLSQYQYLRDHPEIDNVFVVDSTDVEMLHDPFKSMTTGKLYVGDEPATVGTSWMVANAKTNPSRAFVLHNTRLPLLNCGVVGGSREMVMKLCHDVMGMYFDGLCKDQVEMPIFNYLCYTKYSDKIIHGREVTNVFKSFNKEVDSWFAHK